MTMRKRFVLGYGGALALIALGLIVAHAQAPFVAGVMTQDSTGKTIIKPIGRGLYLDPATGTIRTLSWGGLFSTTPNILWITPAAGGNATPVRVDTSTLQLIPDPTISGGMMLSVIPPTVPNPPNIVLEEVPSGTLDGTNVVFILVNVPKTQQVYINGIRQKSNLDYIVTGSTLTFQTGAVPQPGDIVMVDYTW